MTSIPSHAIWSCLNNRRFIISSLGSSLNWNRPFLSDNPRHTTMLLPLQSGSTTSWIPILILSWWTSSERSFRKLASNILESNKNRTPLLFTTPIRTIFNRTSLTSKQIYKISRMQKTHPIPNMLHPWIPTLSSWNSSYLKWRKTSNTCSRWIALMSTSLLLDTTEVSEPLMV